MHVKKLFVFICVKENSKTDRVYLPAIFKTIQLAVAWANLLSVVLALMFLAGCSNSVKTGLIINFNQSSSFILDYLCSGRRESVIT